MYILIGLLRCKVENMIWDQMPSSESWWNEQPQCPYTQIRRVACQPGWIGTCRCLSCVDGCIWWLHSALRLSLLKTRMGYSQPGPVVVCLQKDVSLLRSDLWSWRTRNKKNVAQRWGDSQFPGGDQNISVTLWRRGLGFKPVASLTVSGCSLSFFFPCL